MLLPNVYFLGAYDIVDGVDCVAVDGLVSHKERLVLQFFILKMNREYSLLVTRTMKKESPLFLLDFLLTCIDYAVQRLCRIVNCVKLPVTTVVRGVGASL